MHIHIFTQNAQRAVTVQDNIHLFIHLPLRPAFRAKLQSKNLFERCLSACDVSNTFLVAFKMYLIPAATLLSINRLLCKVQTACSCFCFPSLGLEAGSKPISEKINMSIVPLPTFSTGERKKEQHCRSSVIYLSWDRRVLLWQNIITIFGGTNVALEPKRARELNCSAK